MLFGQGTSLILQAFSSGIAQVPVLIAIALIIIIGYISRYLFGKTKIPEILILITIGVILVPVGNLLPSSYVAVLRSLAPIFGDIALIIIMFNGGRQIRLEKGFGSSKGITLGILDTIVSAIALSLLMNVIFGWPFIYGALLGTILGETAVVVVIPIIKRIRLKQEIYDLLVMETTTNSVVSILVFTLLLSMLTGDPFTVQSFATYSVDYLSVAITSGLLVGIGWLFAQREMKSAREYLATLAVAILLFGVVSLFNGAAIVAVLVFALITGNSKLISKTLRMKITARNQEITEARVTERDLEFLIRTFFFVFIGMIASLSLTYLYYAVIVTVILIILRYLQVKVVLKNKREFQTLVFTLFPRGTVAAVLGAILFGMSIAYSSKIFYIVFIVIVLTNVLAGILLTRVRFKIRQ